MILACENERAKGESPCLSAFEKRNAKKGKRAKMRKNGLKKELEQSDKIALLKMDVTLAYFQGFQRIFNKNTSTWQSDKV